MDATDHQLARATVSLARATIIGAVVTLAGTIFGVLVGKASTDRTENSASDLQLRSTQQEAQLQALETKLAEREASFRELTSKLSEYDTRLLELTRQLSEKEEELQRLRGKAVPTTQRASSAPSDRRDSGAPVQPIATVREQGFEFDLMQCTDDGSSIRCDVIVINKRPDRWMGISSGPYAPWTYLVDTEGNKCSASDSTFGSGELAQDVPLRVTLEFTKCPRNVTRLSYLELGCGLGYLGSGARFKVPFRDVPVK